MPEKNLEPITMGDIEFALLERLDYLAKTDDYNTPIDSWLRCYEVLAQVKQAQALESIAKNLDTIRRLGIPE